MNPKGPYLCVACRNEGHRTAACPRWHSNPFTVSNAFVQASMLDKLRSDRSSFCSRCERYKILDVFDETDIVDGLDNIRYIDGVNHTADVMSGWSQNYQRHNLVLGPVKSILLYSNCPLCRLIFRIFPPDHEVEYNEDPTYYLRPLPSYDRRISFLKEVDVQTKGRYALYFSVESEEDVVKNIARYFGDPGSQMVSRVSESFALSSQNPANNRVALSSRHVNAFVDSTILRHWLQRCKESHSTSCQPNWSDEMLTSRMIDVVARKIVDCPRNSAYVALSYVWGNVKPEEKGLENRSLPQTIEDAITVTRRLDMQYLWVDALCVDQMPTTQQAQQLAMMDVIYQCASLTIVALAGESSNAGLPGVSIKIPRIPQGSETIEGKKLLTVFPMLEQDMEGTKYPTRAWTMQEALLSRRRLVFSANQVHFWCNSARFCESIDESNDPANHTESYHPTKTSFQDPVQPLDLHAEKERLHVGEEDYRECVANYTERSLTNDSDSLNAFLGIVGYLRKAWFPNGFIWGLPLVDFPQSLRWYHPRYVKARRRDAFPSWSWCGWEGQVAYSGPLDLLKEPERGKFGAETDMTLGFIRIDDQVLTVEGFYVTLDIRTEPFSEAYALGTDYLLGPVREGNSLHNNTIPSGSYDFLVVERLRYRSSPERPSREDIYMLLLDWNGNLAVRRSKVRLFLSPGVNFGRAKAERRQVYLK